MGRSRTKSGATPPGGSLPPPSTGPTSGVVRAARALPPEADDPPTSTREATTDKRRPGRRVRVSPNACLERALGAKTPSVRVRWARAGLAGGPCDLDTQAMLLRQLYLGELELGEYRRARLAAEQIVALGVMPDVAHHDAGRACQALEDAEGAPDHMREAARVCPAERRSFHLSTLGALLYAYGRPAEATAVLEEALRTPDVAAPLLRAQLALARLRAENDAAGIEVAFHELLHDRAGEGYGRFVLGELAVARGDRRSAQLFLEAFLAKAKRARMASQAALKPEIDRATELLGRLVWN